MWTQELKLRKKSLAQTHLTRICLLPPSWRCMCSFWTFIGAKKLNSPRWSSVSRNVNSQSVLSWKADHVFTWIMIALKTSVILLSVSSRFATPFSKDTLMQFLSLHGCSKYCFGWSRYLLIVSRLRSTFVQVCKYPILTHPKVLHFTTMVIPDLPAIQQRWVHPVTKEKYIHPSIHPSPTDICLSICWRRRESQVSVKSCRFLTTRGNRYVCEREPHV